MINSNKKEDIKQNKKEKYQELPISNNKRLGLFFSICLLFSFFIFSPSVSSSEDIVEVKGLRHWVNSDSVRVVVDLSGQVEFSKGRLSNPERLFFDLKNAKLIKGIQTNYPVSDKLLKMVRMGQFNANTVRIVFDLEDTDFDFKIFNLEDPSRLIIDILKKGSDEKKAEGKTEARKDSATEIKKEAGIAPGLFKQRIVIDAGHGGHDPGAVGPTGLYEKNVVLDIALKVREIMRKEYPSYEIILTRDRDVFIPLEERAAIANRNKSDLFVSIHANASPNRQARGIETYLLNWSDDAEAMRVAARENAISIKKMRQMQNELGVILASLERENKRDESVKLAGYIQNSLVSAIQPNYPKVNDLGVKQALFYVLVGAKMPSALVEVSFVSNPEEERLLGDEGYRQKLARSVAEGIRLYFSAVSQPKIASDNSSEGYKARPVKYTRRFVR